MKSGLFLSIIYSLLSLTLQAQDVAGTERLADTFMRHGQYETAFKYYQRAFFFASKTKAPELYGKMGESSLMAGKYDFARQYFHKAQLIEQNDSLRAEWFLKKVTAVVLQKRFKLALLEMLNYRGPLLPHQRVYAEYLKGLSYFGMEKFDLAHRHFEAALPPGDSLARQRLNLLFRRKNLMRPNPTAAKWMSMFVPGAGQIYAGDWKNGLNSFFLNGLLAYLILRDAYTYSFWDSFAGIFPWLQRYYTGGYQRAEKIAEQRRREKRARIFRQTYDLIFQTKSKSAAE